MTCLNIVDLIFGPRNPSLKCISAFSSSPRVSFHLWCQHGTMLAPKIQQKTQKMSFQTVSKKYAKNKRFWKWFLNHVGSSLAPKLKQCWRLFGLAYVPDAPILPPQTSHKKKPEKILKKDSNKYPRTRPPLSSKGGNSCGSGNSSKAPAELAFVIYRLQGRLRINCRHSAPSPRRYIDVTTVSQYYGTMGPWHHGAMVPCLPCLPWYHEPSLGTNGCVEMVVTPIKSPWENLQSETVNCHLNLSRIIL